MDKFTNRKEIRNHTKTQQKHNIKQYNKIQITQIKQKPIKHYKKTTPQKHTKNNINLNKTKTQLNTNV